MKKILLNKKKGNIPIVILVLGVLALCFLTLLSFYSSGKETSGSFYKISLLSLVNTASDKILFYSLLSQEFSLNEDSALSELNTLYSFKELRGGIGKLSVEASSGKYVLKGSFIEKTRKFFIFSEEKEVLSVEYPYYP